MERRWGDSSLPKLETNKFFIKPDELLRAAERLRQLQEIPPYEVNDFQKLAKNLRGVHGALSVLIEHEGSDDGIVLADGKKSRVPTFMTFTEDTPAKVQCIKVTAFRGAASIAVYDPGASTEVPTTELVIPDDESLEDAARGNPVHWHPIGWLRSAQTIFDPTQRAMIDPLRDTNPEVSCRRFFAATAYYAAALAQSTAGYLTAPPGPAGDPPA